MLTRYASILILVRMAEQIIPHKEQPNNETAPTSNGGTAAPMVERAFRLLDLLSAAEEGLTLSDLARALDMSKGSMHGLLKTLEGSGVIEQSEERRYNLGPRIYNLAQAYVQRAGLRRFALPAMRRLATTTAETVFLGRIEQQGVRIIERMADEGARSSLHISASRGTRVPLLAGATGRLVLASWPESMRREFLYAQALPRFTEHSITDPEQFLAAVADAGRTGVSVDRGEYLVGVNAVAAPIYGLNRTLVALLWIVGFASRFGEEAIARASQELRSEAEMISRALGASSL